MGAVKSVTHAYTWNEYLFWYIEQRNLPKIEEVLLKKPELVGQSLTVNYKTTPLHRAACNGSLEVVKLLVEKYGADVDLPTEKGETALMGAAKRDQLGVVRYLLTMNANADFVSGCELKAVDYAILGGFYEAALPIYEHMKDRELKDAHAYQQLGRQFHYRYVNYEVLTANLANRVDPDNVPDFLTKLKPVFQDPVVDPRETWKQWFLRNLEFKDPPICERSDLPDDLQPQNARFGKVRHVFNRMTMTHLAPKPEYEPAAHTELSSIDKLKGNKDHLSENLDHRPQVSE